MIKFINKSYPLFTMATFSALQTGLDLEENLSKTHVAKVVTEDAPTSSKNKSPKLFVKQIVPIKIVDLSEFFKNDILNSRKPWQKTLAMTHIISGSHMVSCMFEYHLRGEFTYPGRNYTFCRDKQSLYECWNKLGGPTLSKKE